MHYRNPVDIDTGIDICISIGIDIVIGIGIDNHISMGIDITNCVDIESNISDIAHC